jgi:hypothetical protein
MKLTVQVISLLSPLRSLLLIRQRPAPAPIRATLARPVDISVCTAHLRSSDQIECEQPRHHARSLHTPHFLPSFAQCLQTHNHHLRRERHSS